MTDQHTPGPWQLMFGSTIAAQGRVDTYSGAVWGGIAQLNELEERDEEGRTWTISGNVEANGRLMVAAPEMLAALRAAEDHLAEDLKDEKSHPVGHCPVLDLVRAAIARATETPA